MRPAALVIAAIGLTLLAPREASAYCARPEPAVVPAPGHGLPPDPTLWLFSQVNPAHVVSARASVPMTLGEERTFGDLRVREIRLQATEGTVILWVDDQELRYEVRLDWTRGEDAPALAPGEVAVFSFGCSWADLLRFESQTTAAAFEVRWPGGETVVPAHPEVLLGATRSQPPRLDLGHATCFGWTVSGATRPHAERYAIAALYSDGSRIELTGWLAKTGARAPKPGQPPRPTFPWAPVVLAVVVLVARQAASNGFVAA